MRNTILFFILAAFCALQNGCKKTDSTVNTNSSNVIWPVTFGNTWTYETTNFSANGTVLSKVVLTNSITGSKRVLGKDYALVNTGAFVRNDDQGAWMLRDDSTREFFAFKYPGSVGELFANDTDETSINGKDQILPGVAQIITTDTMITVAAGQFRCYGYEYDYASTIDGKIYEKNFFFLSANIGWIQNDEYQWDNATSALYLRSSVKLLSKDLK
jgi:hypothetical protein